MKFLISVVLVVFSLYGQVIDKLAIIVNNIPITSYDIQKTQKELNVDKNAAVSYLIDQAVLKSIIKQRGIYVDDFDIDNEMKKIAARNGMSLFNFKNYLLQKGELYKLQAQIKAKLQRDKLLQTLHVNITENEIKDYYNKHKEEFALPKAIEVTKYSSDDKQALQQAISNPLSTNDNVSIQDMVLKNNEVNPRLMGFLSQFKEKTFTPIIQFENKLTIFYIIKKDGLEPIPYKMAAGKIYEILLKQKQQKALKDFIDKLRAKADIQFIK
jgi:parvulin-like peptidyl-prolyl isomerase